MKRYPGDDSPKSEGMTDEKALALMFGEGKLEGLIFDVSEFAQRDMRRRVRGLAPRYGFLGAPGRLRDDESSPAPAAITPKIYSGGDGSNHYPPVAGAATVQRVRETASMQQQEKQRMFVRSS